jgi:DNA-binding transcriptional ArsR family regulator
VEVLRALADPVRLEMLRMLEDARIEVPRGKIPSSWESWHPRGGHPELAIIEYEYRRSR